MEPVNTGVILEALNNKTDRNMRNIDTGAKADSVIDYQEPTAENGYTWYRKYASGWVEQGGLAERNTVVTLPIEMTDTNYVTVLTGNATTNNYYSYGVNAITKTPTSFTIKTESSSVALTGWQVSGYAA